MRQIHSMNTKPEIKVRSLLHKMGYRFRIHKINLPGKPDVVLSKYKKVIFVHGCFWHRHQSCIEASHPKTNSAYWEEKITKNMIRDRKNEAELLKLGWEVIIIWECELKGQEETISEFLRNRIFYQ